MKLILLTVLLLGMSMNTMASERSGGSNARARGGEANAGAVISNDYEVPVASARAPDCGVAMQFKDWGFSAGYVTDLCKLELARGAMNEVCRTEIEDKGGVRPSCVRAREIANEMYELVMGDYQGYRARLKRALRKLPVVSWLAYVL